jgi:hypothetical protein
MLLNNFDASLIINLATKYIFLMYLVYAAKPHKTQLLIVVAA